MIERPTVVRTIKVNISDKINSISNCNVSAMNCIYSGRVSYAVQINGIKFLYLINNSVIKPIDVVPGLILQKANILVNNRPNCLISDPCDDLAWTGR